MAILNIRNLPEEVHAQLRIRAAKAGRSMEAEARYILTTTVMESESMVSAESLQLWVDELYADQKPTQVVEELIADRRREAMNE
jgi:plasmid stability protein